MCRFLLAKSDKPFNPKNLLEKFADMAKKSKAYDGDWQGDGWGISWWSGHSWEQYVSLKPVWEDRSFFDFVPDSKMVCVHARSASFAKHKNKIDYNQPFIFGKYAFVFNGLIKGVTFPYRLEGQIGSQKIWSLIKMYLRKNPPKVSLEKAVGELNKYSRFIQALNIGLCDGENIFTYNQFSKHEEYYRLQYAIDHDLTIVVSEKISGFNFYTKNTKKVIRMV